MRDLDGLVEGEREAEAVDPAGFDGDADGAPSVAEPPAEVGVPSGDVGEAAALRGAVVEEVRAEAACDVDPVGADVTASVEVGVVHESEGL